MKLIRVKCNDMISYEDFLLQSKKLNDEVDKFDKILQDKYKKVGGLIPNEIRNSPEYRTDKSNFDKAFKQLQEFNSKIPKEYARRRSMEKRGMR